MIREIDGFDDPTASEYRHVGDDAWLRGHGLFVAEGRLVLDRLLSNGGYTLRSVLVTPAALAALAARLATVQSPILVARPEQLREITGFNFHRGCLALAYRRPAAALDDVARGDLLLGLEGVGNPDNAGGLFRTALAFGLGGILLDERSVDPLYRKALRTSMGAVLDLPFAFVQEWRPAMNRLHADGFQIVALTPTPSAEPLEAFVRTAPAPRLLVIVGAEGPGLTDDVLAAADRRIRVPIASAVDSLNVVVAAGIALARIVESRQRL